MKHFIKMAFYLLLIIGATSCEKDLYDDALIKNQMKINKVEEFYLHDLKFNKKFNFSFDKVMKTKNQKALLNRTVLEDEYNFTIVNNVPIKIITNDDGSIYYNILIERTTSEDLKFENLVIKEQYEEVEAFIVKYTLSALAEKEFNHNSFNLDIINTEIKNLEVDGKFGAPCHTTMTIYCDDIGADDGTWTHDHIAGAVCFAHSTNLYMVTETICDFGGGGDGDGSGLNPSGNGMGNNGSGGGNAPLIPLTPTPLNSSIKTEKDPCVSLTAKSEETKFRQKFKDLNSNSRFNFNGETAYFETRENNEPQYTFKQPYEGEHSVKITYGTISFMHVHNNVNIKETDDGILTSPTVKMISPGDINTFISTCQTAANLAGVANTDTYGMMISSEGIFAIKMLQNDTSNPAIANFEIMNARFTEMSNKIYQNNPGSSPNDKSIRKNKLQKLLLSLMNEYGLNNKVALFEGEVQPNEPGQQNLPVINWKRKTLNNNGELVESPC